MGSRTEIPEGEGQAPELAPESIGFSISPVAPATVKGGKVSKPRGKAGIKRVPPAETQKTVIGRTPRKLLIPGTLDHAFHIVGGRDVAISLTRLASHTDKQFFEWVRIWDNLSPVEQGEPDQLERLCLAVGLHPSDYFGRLAALAYKRNFDVAHFAAAVAAPLVMDKAAKFGQKEKNFKDRQMILQVTGHLERGPLVQVNQNSDNRSVSVTQSGPSFEELTAKVSQMIRGGESQDVIDAVVIDNPLLEAGDEGAVNPFEEEPKNSQGFKVREE